MGAARSPEETPLTGSKWNLQPFRTDNDDTRISLTCSSLVNANEIQYASAATCTSNLEFPPQTSEASGGNSVNRIACESLQQDNKTKASNFNAVKWIRQLPHFVIKIKPNNEVT